MVHTAPTALEPELEPEPPELEPELEPESVPTPEPEPPEFEPEPPLEPEPDPPLEPDDEPVPLLEPAAPELDAVESPGIVASSAPVSAPPELPPAPASEALLVVPLPHAKTTTAAPHRNHVLFTLFIKIAFDIVGMWVAKRGSTHPS
ncbi:MAG: hypothetical protein M3O46_16640, partial [Myxococcota bacterium]|nr:hypothetical protein [Myxococcota bacterium]